MNYYDVNEPYSHYEQISLRGFQGGGPTCFGITYGAIKLSNSELLDKIRFEDEAEGLAIWSADKSTLEQIGRLISTVKLDELMDNCINVAEADWQME